MGRVVQFESLKVGQAFIHGGKRWVVKKLVRGRSGKVEVDARRGDDRLIISRFPSTEVEVIDE